MISEETNRLLNFAGYIDPELVASLILAILCAFVLWQRLFINRAARYRKRLPPRLRLTLNSVSTSQFRIRTLIDIDFEPSVYQGIDARLLAKAAGKVSRHDPFLDVGKSNELLVRAVLNSVSARFSDGFIARDAGLPVVSMRYLLALAVEKDRFKSAEEISVLLIKPEDLERFASTEISEILQIEAERQRRRVETLQAMHDLWIRGSRRVGELELVIKK